MILMRVIGTVMSLPNDTEVRFDAGIDDLEHLSRIGQKFSIEVEVVERDGDRVVVVPAGLAQVDA